MTKEQATREAYWERVARIKEEMLRVSYEENKLLKEALQQRPQNCGTGYCSCIECVMEPEPVAFICQGNLYMAGDIDEYCTAKHIPLYTHPPVPYVTESRTAQPEQDIQKIGCVNHDCDKCKAQPEQEPVAWCVYCDEQFNLNIFRVKDVADVEKVRLDLEYPNHKRKVVPLYTTPPQRKPLTDEQIGAILEGVNAYGTRLYTFARAIEAAHGIKE